MKETDLIESKELRDKCVNHYEVLEKVKELLLIPGTEFATITDIADFYEVSTEPIQKLYQRNKTEIDMDGIKVISAKELIGQECPIRKNIEKTQFKTHVSYDNGRIVDIPNRGIKVFPRRAILRIGMMLRDSVVAKSVRDQLLNIEEKTDNETKTTDITEEQKLMLSVGMAYASGDINAMLKATTEYNAFQNRHIEALETDNGKLVADNKALAEGNLEWSDRSQINYAIRRLSGLSGVTVQKLWGDLYNQLLYKHHMNVRARGKQPWIQYVEEHEWNCVNKVFSSMCNSYGLSASEILEGIKVK